MPYKKHRILFVCTGNVFRSVSAEYCMKDYLHRSFCTNMIVRSAGISAEPDIPDPWIIEVLKTFNIHVKNHHQTKVTSDLLDNQSLVIAMAKNHQDFIMNNFGLHVPLFNELSINKKTSVDDVDEVVEDYKNRRKESKDFMKKTIEHIYYSIPNLYKELKNVL